MLRSDPLARPAVRPDTGWWRTSRRRVFYDAHTPDWTDPHQLGSVADRSFPLLSEVDPEGDLELMSQAGVDSVVLFAKCQYGNAYYPSRIGRVHAALNGRDLFGEQLAAAHARGIRVIAYYSNMWDVAAAGEHPEWALEPLPSRGSTGRWPSLCLLSGYRQRALDQVREIAERYPIDGLWSDILTAGPCVCERCRSAFRGQYGRDMPADRDDDGWLDLIHFWQGVLGDYLDEQRAVLKAARPEAALIPNYYATTFVDAVTGLTTDHLAAADIGSSEGYTDWHGLGFPSYAAAYIRAGVQERPAEVLVSRFVHTWDFTLRSTAQLRFESFAAAAHGVAVSVDDQPYATGAIEPEVYRRLEPVFGRIAEREPWLGGTPVRHAALYASQRARELESLLGAPENPTNGEQSAQFPQSEPRSAPSDLVAALTGTYRALRSAHLPVAFLDERPSSIATLDEYAVLVLPDALCLDDAEIAAVRAFVAAGGGLVVTGPAGVRDARGVETAAPPALTDLLGVRFDGLGEYTYPYLRPTEPLGAWPVPHYGRMPRLEVCADDVRVLATRVDPVLETDDRSFWHNNQPAPGADSGEPVIVEREFGAGRVIVSAARLGNNLARLGNGAYGRLLADLVERAAPRPVPVLPAPGAAGTEVVLSELPGRLVAHLVTGHPVVSLDVHGAPQPAAIEDVASIAGLRLSAPPGARAASRIVDGAEVPLAIVDGGVVLESADDWETVVFDLGEQA
ncbi:beta-galactosidase trimerization domain-containing protein [Agromyces sp. SYSU T00194]|uniref:beta-galactosidase trimerization domain-containing protein n=1 Tax=Agromyces chitinivorans TaxID=3158560 RepID=UPI00339662D6